jgi:hypothetical protein
MVRVVFEHLAIEAFGFVEVALLVEVQGLFEKTVADCGRLSGFGAHWLNK